MTRISATKLVQRVEDDLVILDEATGEEVVLRGIEVVRLYAAMPPLFWEQD